MSTKVEEESIQIKDFELFLRKSLNYKQLELVNLETAKLLPLGENYASVMLKLEAKIRKNKESKEEVVHLVAKTMNPSDKPIVNWSEVLKKEAFMYTDIIPAYQNFEREMGVTAVLDLLPKYIGHRCSLDDKDVDERDSILVLENLKERGFYNCERLKGMDLEHTKAAFSSLAKFHATGIALRQKYPKLFESLLPQAHRLIGVNFELLDDSFDSVLEIFRQSDCFAKNIEVIEDTFKDIKNGQIYAWRASTPQWGTVTHADFWTNNIMFHKDSDGRIDEVKLVDFQLYVFNSPVRDLSTFLGGGNIDENAREYHIDDLLNVYYDTFIKRLQQLGCDSKSFSRQAFDLELKKQAINVFPYCAIMARFYVVDISKENDRTILSNILQSKASDALIERLQALVELYEKRGWF